MVLEKFGDRLIACRVVIAVPHRHYHQGNIYHRLHELIAPNDRWESLQHQIGRASECAKTALESAWNQLTNRKT